MTRTPVAAARDVKEGELCQVKVDGKPVLLSRVKGKVCAFSAKCPHIGLSLAKGKVDKGVIRCPFHGSRFDMASGANLDWANAVAGLSMPKWSHGLLAMGNKPAPLEMYKAEERDGSIFIE